MEHICHNKNVNNLLHRNVVSRGKRPRNSTLQLAWGMMLTSVFFRITCVKIGQILSNIVPENKRLGQQNFTSTIITSNLSAMLSNRPRESKARRIILLSRADLPRGMIEMKQTRKNCMINSALVFIKSLRKRMVFEKLKLYLRD